MKCTGLFIISVCLFSCGPRQEQDVTITADTLEKATSTVNHSALEPEDSVIAGDTAVTITPKALQPRNPSGVYSVTMPFEKSWRIEHTVDFYPDHTFRLQERFINGQKDSTIMMSGSWTPSNDFIWLYKDQVVQGRYKWKGEVLQYYDPRQNRNHSMQKLSSVMQNPVWKNKKKEGILFFGIGNEPFWSVELNNRDSISFLLSEWSSPVKMLLTSTTTGTDSTVYLARTDSVQLKMIVWPYFCSDGMSDFVYRNKIQVVYNNEIYKGCGESYQ